MFFHVTQFYVLIFTILLFLEFVLCLNLTVLRIGEGSTIHSKNTFKLDGLLIWIKIMNNNGVVSPHHPFSRKDFAHIKCNPCEQYREGLG